MKVAFTTENGKHVDSHFGWAKRIAVYDVYPDHSDFVSCTEFDGTLAEDGNEDKLAPKLEAIQDCAILYVAAIGGSGAARVVARKVHPVKVAETEKIESILLQLQRVLSANPPPWLRKALHKSRARTIDYEDGVVYE